MKNLHKKIGAGALVVVLLSAPVAYAGRFSGIYIPGGRMVHENPPISKQADLKVPFLLGSQLYVASEEEIAKNDKNMVYGLGGIFNYSIYSGHRPAVIERYMKDIGSFKGGNEFLEYLLSNGIDDASKMYVVRVGSQDYQLQFNSPVKKGKMWWLDLDRWQYGAKVAFQSLGIKY